MLTTGVNPWVVLSGERATGSLRTQSIQLGYEKKIRVCFGSSDLPVRENPFWPTTF